MGVDARVRFFEKVEYGDSCWEWKAARNDKGYGNFRDRDRKTISAHRFAYEALVGPIPEGLTLDHLCRNRRCVNPAHLEAVTKQENQRRGLRGELLRQCKQGHPFDEENTIWVSNEKHGTKRKCRICTLAAYRRYNAKRPPRAKRW